MSESGNITALFPGSFNPFTLGHADIVARALRLFDRVVIGVGFNEHKADLSSVRQRTDDIRRIYACNPRVEVESYSCLTADFARSVGASVIVRGVRGSADFEYEKNLADINSELLGIDTIFLPCRPSLSYLSSSAVRELSHFGHDVTALLPHAAEDYNKQ